MIYEQGLTIFDLRSEGSALRASLIVIKLSIGEETSPFEPFEGGWGNVPEVKRN
jgi:hypothetical protein